jgi:hypothetical protein
VCTVTRSLLDSQATSSSQCLTEGVHRVLVGKPEGTRPRGRPRRRWEDNIKTDLQGSGRGLWGLDGAGSG